MGKKKLLFIAPHLSTGGMPQYLYKQIETLKDVFDIWCAEWEDVTGGHLVVQRNRILNLLGKNLITLDQDKHHLFKIIEEYNPDIIHLQEIPEMFMPYEIAEKLYNVDRDYTIVETSHDSSYNVDNKLHFPDKFMMVSQYQINAYQKLGIPCELVEYPIEEKQRTKSRLEILNELGLDPNKKHVITVGLFTPRKNQAEVIEYAKLLQNEPIQFHFIGNQADNFKYYWEPLMKDFPSNCTWWGERSDVDTFYQMADLFLFTSRGHSSDKETMPLVIREAISWKVPSLIYNLEVYLNYFDKHENIDYLDFEDKNKNAEAIVNKLFASEKKEYKKNIFIIDVYATTESKYNLLRDCIESVRPMKCPIMVVSHCVLPEDIVKSVDYHIYDADNSFNNNNVYSFRTSEEVEIRQNITRSHEFPIIRAMRLALETAQVLGYEEFYFSEFDHKYSKNGLKQLINLDAHRAIQGKDFVFFFPAEAVFGDIVGQYFESCLFLGSTKKFLQKFNSYFPYSLEEYNNNFTVRFPNCLEHFFYECFKDANNLIIPKYAKEYFSDSIINVSSYQNIAYVILLDEDKQSYLTIVNNNHVNYEFEVEINGSSMEAFNLANYYKIIELNKTSNIHIKVFENGILHESKQIKYDHQNKDQYASNGLLVFKNKKIKEESMRQPINISYDKTQNKFDITYETDMNRGTLMSIKDINSKACIYSSFLNSSGAGSSWWVIPLPKNVIDFENSPYFGGFLIELRDESGELLETRRMEIKDIPIKKPVIDISNTEPVFMNYEEFFIEGVYDNYDLDNCNVVFDIGANVGMWTKYILTRNAKKVYCFEPNKKAISHLKESLKNDSNTAIVEKAVYKENTSLQFYIDDSNSLISSLIPESGHTPSYNVDAITLEEAIRESGESHIDLVKIDVEGSEFGIIESLTQETANKIDSFLIEYHDFYFQEGMQKVYDLIGKLENLGYTVEKSTIKNSKFIYAAKIRKNYWLNKKEQVKLYNLHNFSKDFTWDSMRAGLHDGNNHMYKEMHYTYDDYTNGCVYERLGCKIEKGDVVVDLGANVGVFANAAYYKGASKIYSFEPTDAAYKCLIKNKPINCQTFKMGVGNEEKFEIISVDSTDNTMSATFTKADEISEYVPMTTLDSLFDKGVFDKIDFLKIDVEGYEYKILEGLSDSNLNKIRKIALEFHSNMLSEEVSQAIMNRMVSNDFNTFQLFIDDGTLRIYNFWK